jgi:exopolyphosphatase/guanosine-5'-triphosphate,3'-diphosphate pyrophosphatase
MIRTRASIDIGTHTARLLIASGPEQSGNIRAFSRKREYIRLAEHFDYSKERIIQPEAIDRTLNVLQAFLQDIKMFNVRSIHAIATGVVRDAENRDEFLGRIYEETGIQVKLVAGDEEALLTARGTLHALDSQSRPILIFDLGGGSTEFFYAGNDTRAVKSIPLGSMILTEKYLTSDPPEDNQLHWLSRHIDQTLGECREDILLKGAPSLLVGTGGTVITLAMMLNGIEPEDITEEHINGLVLGKEQIERLFSKMKRLRFDARLRLTGLDRGRAGIILAGTLVVMSILRFSKALQLTACMSDLLEGVLIENYKGESNE